MVKILLVEDNEMNRDMLSRRLARRGYEVVIAKDGQEGLDLAGSTSPDLILMDMSLPSVDGWRQPAGSRRTCPPPSRDRADRACDVGDREQAPRPVVTTTTQNRSSSNVCSRRSSPSLDARVRPCQLVSVVSSNRKKTLAKLRHDLRTPINAIIGYSELLKEDLADRGVKDLDDLEKIASAARELLEMIATRLNDPARGSERAPSPSQSNPAQAESSGAKAPPVRRPAIGLDGQNSCGRRSAAEPRHPCQTSGTRRTSNGSGREWTARDRNAFRKSI